MLSVYCNRYQDDWDIHLQHVAFAYNTTVSSVTGYTPFFMIFGREARQLCNEWVDSFMTTSAQRAKESKFNIPDYVTKTAEALQLGWDLTGSKRTATVETWNKKHRARLAFKEYQIGARFFLRYIPTATAKTTSKTTLTDFDDDKLTHKTAADFQARWTGPYRVTKKFSPVLYETIINGTPRRVHALHMKPDPICDTLRLNIPLEETDPTPLPSMLAILESENPTLPIIVPTPLPSILAVVPDNPTEPTTSSNEIIANTPNPTIPTVPIDTTSNDTRVLLPSTPSTPDSPTDLPSMVMIAPTTIPPIPRPIIIAQPLRTRFFDEIPQEDKRDNDAQTRLLQQLNLVPTPTKPKKAPKPPPIPILTVHPDQAFAVKIVSSTTTKP
jgi:hypothetical protein